MAKARTPGLGKSKGQVGMDFKLDDGEYLVQAQSCKFEWKPGTTGFAPEEEGCPFMYTFKLKLVGGPEQESGKKPAGMPWTYFAFIDPESEWKELMADKLKNCLNAFHVTVRADAFKMEDVDDQEAVMVIVNKQQKKGKYEGDWRSEITEFKAVEDVPAYAGT